MSLPTLEDIRAARKRLEGVAHHTPMTPSATFSERTGADVHLKLENLQRTGSFKIRGAYNRIARLTDEERARGVVAASAGNHAQGVSLAARLAGIPCVIVMPERASMSKAEAVRGYGAELLLHGRDYNEAEAKAKEIGAERGMTFVHAFDDADVIAGQGTLGLEIMEDLPEVDTIVVPVGGGGLISGVAIAAKAIKPNVRIVAVEPTGAAKLTASLQKGSVQTLAGVNTIADGLATRRVGNLPFEAIQKHVSETVQVDDDDTAMAILYLLERAKTLVEGGGAVALAAVLSGRIPFHAGERIAVVLSGGNIDVGLLDTILQRGLQQTGRVLEVKTVLEDRPGALRDLLALLAKLQVNVERIDHDRTRFDVSLGHAEVSLRLGTRGGAHADEALETLAREGYKIVRK